MEERPTLVRPLLQAVMLGFEPARLTRFQGMLRGTDSFTRVKKLTDESFSQIEVDLVGGVFSSLHFHERSRADQDRGVPGLSVILTNGPSAAGAFPYQVEVTAPLTETRTIATLVGGFERAVKLLESPYCFIGLNQNLKDAQEEVGAIPIIPFDPTRLSVDDQLPEVRERANTLFAYQRARPVLGEKIRRAYWGNFLGKQIVEQLGGIDRVKSTAPAAELHEIHNGGLYLQASSRFEFDSPNAVASLAALDHFLRPVTI